MKCNECGTYVCICDTTFDDADLDKMVDRYYNDLDDTNETELVEQEDGSFLLDIE